MLLSEYDFEVEHRAGSSMRHADALSRNPLVLNISTDNLIARIRAAQEKDSQTKAIIELLKYKDFDDYFIEGNLLYKLKDGKKHLAIPRSLQPELIRNIHEDGHFAGKKLETRIIDNYYFPDL